MLKKEILSCDLCVVGGGLAGICAAVAAARRGASVVLMHERPVLGGNASSEIRMWVCGAQGENNRETGIIEEIILENCYRNPTKNFYIWDTVLYSFVKREKNITLLLNCTCMDADVTNGVFADGRTVYINSITGYQMTTQKNIEVRARYYSDCSGDSILAPLTGAAFRIGREGSDEFGEDTIVEKHDSLTMGMSCLIQGRETDRKIDFIPPEWSTKLSEEHFKYRHPDLYSTYENFWYLELGGSRDTVNDTEEIAAELIPLALGTWDHIKHTPEYKADNFELEFLGFLPGKRESRRMCGEYIITQRDISQNVQFEDTVAYGGWPLDDHYPDGFYHTGHPNRNIYSTSPYCIPYRALYSENVENLFFAGRNISMTHTAMSSIRVMMTCALLGEAVGAAAAIAARCGITPHGVYREKLCELTDTLMRGDCFLPNRTRRISEKCRGADLSASDTLRDGRDRTHRIYGDYTCGDVFENGTAVTYTLAGRQKINSVHIVFDSDLNRLSLPGDECERYHATRCNILKSSPDTCVPKTLCRRFRLTGTVNGKTETICEVSENIKRAYDIAVGKEYDSISLIPEANWGGSESTAVLSFDFD